MQKTFTPYSQKSQSLDNFHKTTETSFTINVAMKYYFLLKKYIQMSTGKKQMSSQGQGEMRGEMKGQMKGQMSESTRNYYEILGVNPNATLQEIENSYQKLALKWHPEKHTADRMLAERKFRQISQAFEVLSDPNKRSTYDQMFSTKTSLQNAYRTFDQFFGQNQMISEEQEKFFEKNFPERRKNYYKVLGLNKDATMQEITEAYRKLALKYHPKSNSNNEQARRKFIEINEAYQTLSNQSRRSSYDDLIFGEIVPRRAYDIFENFFEDRWMDIPSQTDFFKPIFDRRSRMLSNIGNLGSSGLSWNRMLTSDLMPRRQLQNIPGIKQGQSFYKEEKYQKKNGKQNHVSQTVRRKIKNGQVEEETLKQNIFPTGQRDVVKTIKRGDKVDTKTFHLGRNESMPRQLTNF